MDDDPEHTMKATQDFFEGASLVGHATAEGRSEGPTKRLQGGN